MTLLRREIYRSAPNGDRWSLVRETGSGRVVIEQPAQRVLGRSNDLASTSNSTRPPDAAGLPDCRQ
jgi:hypothetical protein